MAAEATKAALEEAGRITEESMKDMMEHVITAVPVAVAKQAGEQLLTTAKTAFRQPRGQQQQAMAAPEPDSSATLLKCGYVKTRNPRAVGELSKYSCVRLSVDSANHIREKKYSTEETWKKAAAEPNALTPPMTDVLFDMPVAIRFCTMTTTTKSVLVQAPNPGYTDADYGYIEPVQTLKKIKFDSKAAAVEWATFLAAHTGDEHGYAHVDTAELTGKVLQGTVQGFQTDQMGTPLRMQRAAAPSKDAMSTLIISRVYKLAVIPKVQTMKLPIVNTDAPAFMKKKGFKAVAAQINKQVGDRLAGVFTLIEGLVKQLASYVQQFIDQLVAFVMEHFIQPIVDWWHRRQANQANEPPPDPTSIRQRIMAKARELSAAIPFAALFAHFRTALSHANINLSQRGSTGFDEHHYELMATSELERLVTQYARDPLHR